MTHIHFQQSRADLFFPDGLDQPTALARTTHLGIGAHQDDLEFMALHGILECFQQSDRWFSGITCTDGAGSSRTGAYADYTDEQMKEVRVREQRAAAVIGQYGFMAQLGHPSSVAKQSDHRSSLVADLEALFQSARPEVIYTHNPFDKHATHVGVLLAVLEALRNLPGEVHPRQLIGCEVWRGLDWLPDAVKIVQPLDAHPNLAAALNGVFDSQISGGKRYDLAVEGRRLANATFFDAHSVDVSQRVAYAVDLTSLIGEDPRTLDAFCQRVLGGFQEDVTENYRSLQ